MDDKDLNLKPYPAALSAVKKSGRAVLRRTSVLPGPYETYLLRAPYHDSFIYALKTVGVKVDRRSQGEEALNKE